MPALTEDDLTLEEHLDSDRYDRHEGFGYVGERWLFGAFKTYSLTILALGVVVWALFKR